MSAPTPEVLDQWPVHVTPEQWQAAHQIGNAWLEQMRANLFDPVVAFLAHARMTCTIGTVMGIDPAELIEAIKQWQASELQQHQERSL